MKELIDIDGNTYKTVKIGNQVWMAENLKVTKFRDGTVIPNVTDNNSWTGLSTGAYCYYNNDSGNGETYGALYNWKAVNDSRNIAPEGWHVPSDAEWQELVDYLGGVFLAGKKLKSTSGWSKSGNGTDAVGFGALPGGYRYHNGGYFNDMGTSATFWSASEDNMYNAWYRNLDYYDVGIFRSYYYKEFGLSVRCIKDKEE